MHYLKAKGVKQQAIITRITSVTEDIRQTLEERGTETITQLEVTPSNEQFSLGERVIDINVLYNVRSRNIEVIGKKLKKIKVQKKELILYLSFSIFLI